MRLQSPNTKQIPLGMVGGTNFGRYPKISTEQTFNMIVSDGFLVSYAGYENVVSISPNGVGRGIYASSRLGKMIAVIDNGIYTVDDQLVFDRVGDLDTYAGDVSIAENNGSQIAICDKSAIYIYDYAGSGSFQKVTTDFIPAYVAFQNGYFIAAEAGQPKWRLSDLNNGLSWPAGASNVGEFETDADNVLAAFPIPGKGNLLFVMGSLVTEPWFDIGTSLFPYQKNTQSNIAYGALNSATIDWNEKFVVWLGINRKSGPAILLSEGGDVKQISNEGFNYRFSRLNKPQNCTAFLFKQDGHLIYQMTFYDPSDNLSLAYDFETNLFFTLTDEYMNYHIARRVVFFNNTYYFVSFRDGNIYEFSTKYNTLDGVEMPCIRIPKNLRFPDSSRFVVNNITFLMEQGESANEQRIDLSLSIDGGESFSSYGDIVANPLGKRQNRVDFWQLGAANDFVPQFRFQGKTRHVIGEGEVSVYQ
jgi:hypothetical protein